MSNDLRTLVVMDYQNVHLTGHGLFASTEHLPLHETLIDPLLFSLRLLQMRNARQRSGMAAAVLSGTKVFRGQPTQDQDPRGYARNLAQKSRWQRDQRVSVTLRPLKYDYERDATGSFATDVRGHRIVRGRPREKGIDVLCALAAVRAAHDPAIDCVIVASSDSDLAPVLDEVRRIGQTKVETFCWYDQVKKFGYQLHPTERGRPVWNTRLYEDDFHACFDPTAYS